MVVDAVKLLRQARRQIKEAAAPTAPQSPVTQSTRPPADSPPALWLRTFPVDDGDELRVWEDPRGTLGGGNGATVWDSALAFSTAVLSDDDESLAATTDWRGLRVLELGSGCGLVALALACRGARVVAMERAIALPLLEKNVAANAALVGRRGGTLETAALDWTAPDATVLDRGYDAVVGADLCFAANAAGAAALASIVAGLLRRIPIGIVAQELRERDATPTAFLEDLRRRGASAQERTVAGASDVVFFELARCRPALPHEALPVTFAFLPAEALATCGTVAREWAVPGLLWKERVHGDFGADVLTYGPWRRRYLELRESLLEEEVGTYAGLC